MGRSTRARFKVCLSRVRQEQTCVVVEAETKKQAVDLARAYAREGLWRDEQEQETYVVRWKTITCGRARLKSVAREEGLTKKRQA